MRKKEQFWTKKKKIQLTSVLVIGIISIIGISYAYWKISISQTGINKVASTCLSLSLTKEENAIRLENAFPILDEDGKKTTPYSFTVENTCDMFASYTITLEVTKESTLNGKYVASMLNTNAIQTLNELEKTTVSNEDLYKEAYILGTGSLGTGDSEDYALRLWIDEDVTIQDDAMNKTFEARVVITASPSTYSPVENGFTTLHDAILANEYQVTELQSSIDKINAKQQPDFTKTAPIIEWQETSKNDTTSVSFTMPDPADVGSGKDYASGLTSSNVYVGFATSYRFDSEMGRYYLENMIYQDPSTIDFSNGNYYVCGSGTNVTSAGKLSPYSNTNCTTMYKIGGFTKAESATISGSSGDSYPGKKYTFQRSKQYTQTELESDKSDKGLYAMTDDYGTSYYYRGSVKNNYVQFAGYYWRIIRINGDGSIRLMYAGTKKDASGSAAQIGTKPFNTNRNLPLYVGYMYGNPSGTTLQEVNANTTDSTIKTYLESWYNTNLSEYSEFIADTGFCNDRTLATYSWNGNGVQTDKNTNYAAYERYYTNYSPTLNCPDKTNDLFTVENELGNQASNAPIGLITIDELMLAGYRRDYINKLAYPYTGVWYWTMSPYLFYAANATAGEFGLGSDGVAIGAWVAGSYGVRPVINLKSDTLISEGIGTQNNPFVVK